jgi:F0F1-type ATP synthase delta subunit
MIDKVLDSFFNAKETPNAKMKKLFPYHLYDYFEHLAAKQSVLLDDKPMLKNFLVQVKTFVQHIPVVTIEIPFIPTSEMLANMSNYLSIYIKRTILFDISLNKNLIAGAKLSFNGKFKDFSYKKNLDEKLAQEAEIIIKNL